MQDTKPTGRKFRFRLGLTIAFVPALAVLLTLGTWQIQRHFWKQDVLNTRAAQLAGTPCPLSAYRTPPSRCTIYRLDDAQVAVHAFTYGSDRDAGVPGQFLVGGVFEPVAERSIWVRLGFVPTNRIDKVISVVEGYPVVQLQALTIVVRSDGWKGAEWAKPINDPGRGLWAYLQADELNAHFNWHGEEGVILDAIAVEGVDHLVPIDPLTEIPNNHWHYALTWFSLALIMSVFYVAMSLQPIAKNEEENP